MAREITVRAGRYYKAGPPAEVLGGHPRRGVSASLMSVLPRAPRLRLGFWLLVVAWLAFPDYAYAAGEQAPGGNLLKGWRIQDRTANRPAEGRARELVIAATSDLHGWIVRDTLFPAARPGGLAHLAPLIPRLRQEAPGLILLDGGDTLQGAPNLEYLARRDAALPPLVLRLMNRLGYDAMTLGNHDLERGQAALARWVAQAAFPWLAANVTDRQGRPLLPPYHIIERGEVRVAVLGLITPGTPIWVDGAHLAGLRFGDMRAAVRRWMPVLRERERADVVVGVFHSGLGGWYDRSVAVRHGLPLPNAAGLIADDTPGFDLIVSGHAHRLSPRRRGGGNSAYAVPIVQPGARGEALAVARLELRAVGGRWKVTGMTREIQRAAISPDSDLLAETAPVLAGTRAWLAQPTAVHLTAIPGRDDLYACAGQLSHDAVSQLAAKVAAPRVVPRTEEPARGPFAEPATAAKESGRPFSLLPLLWRFDQSPPPFLPAKVRRAHLHRWMRHANSLVLARLNTRQIALLLDPYARWWSGLRVRASAVLHPGGLKVRIASGGTEVLGLGRDRRGGELARHSPQPVWLTNYHWNGGGGLARRALIHPRQLVRRSALTLRELVFRLLSDPDYALPNSCRVFLGKS